MKRRKRVIREVAKTKIDNVICATCKKGLGYKKGLPKDALSHGICPECEKEFDKEMDAYFKKAGKAVTEVLKEDEHPQDKVIRSSMVDSLRDIKDHVSYIAQAGKSPMDSKHRARVNASARAIIKSMENIIKKVDYYGKFAKN